MEFQTHEVLSSSKHHISQNIAKLYLFQICHVYTDAVQNQLVGDVKAPLIQVVPVKDGNVTYVHYNKPNFLPISSCNISFVKLSKKNENGNFHLFQSVFSRLMIFHYFKFLRSLGSFISTNDFSPVEIAGYIGIFFPTNDFSVLEILEINR